MEMPISIGQPMATDTHRSNDDSLNRSLPAEKGAATIKNLPRNLCPNPDKHPGQIFITLPLL